MCLPRENQGHLWLAKHLLKDIKSTLIYLLYLLYLLNSNTYYLGWELVVLGMIHSFCMSLLHSVVLLHKKVMTKNDQK